jgi:seryl-tRNA synthetase
MPVDINLLRVDRGGDPEAIRLAQRKRGKPDDLVDRVLALDLLWRDQTTQMRHLQTRLNKLQKEVIAEKKKNKESCEAEIAEKHRLEKELQQLQEAHVECEHERYEQLCKLGNIVDDSVPFATDEDEDNDVVCVWPMPENLQLPCRIGNIAYELPGVKPLTHDDLLWRIGGYDPGRGSKVAGGRGYFLRDAGVLLNQAIINFAIAFLRDLGYSAVQVPFFMKKDLMAGVAQLSDFDEQLYKVATGKTGDMDDPADKYLIATSEQPLCAYHHKEVLDERELPLRYAGVSTCFRKEVGKANVDNRGIFRVHQFEKVEQFCITTGDVKESKKMHLEMLNCAEDFYKALRIPFRVVNIVSGALNDAAMIKYDLEGWFPGQGQYRELVSCSNCTDFQSRAMDTRCRAHRVDEQNSSKVELSHVHMLNSTLAATGRVLCCILETYQATDGVHVPAVLVPYMAGTTFLPFLHEPREAGTVEPLPLKLTKRSQVVNTVSMQKPSGLQPILVHGEVQLNSLDAKLVECPYVEGFRPSQSDKRFFDLLQATAIEPGLHPNAVRWFAHVASFTPTQRAAWG